MLAQQIIRLQCILDSIRIKKKIKEIGLLGMVGGLIGMVARHACTITREYWVSFYLLIVKICAFIVILSTFDKSLKTRH